MNIYGYQLKKGEPKNVEYRIKADQVDRKYHISERDDVLVTSLLFIKKFI